MRKLSNVGLLLRRRWVLSARGTGHVVSEWRDTGCRLLHKPSFIRKREGALSPRSCSWMRHSALPSSSSAVCGRVCAEAGTLHIWLLTLAALSRGSQTLTRCNNSNVVGLACWLLQVLSHTQTHSSGLVLTPNKQPRSTVECWGIYAKRRKRDSISEPRVRWNIPLSPFSKLQQCCHLVITVNCHFPPLEG